MSCVDSSDMTRGYWVNTTIYHSNNFQVLVGNDNCFQCNTYCSMSPFVLVAQHFSQIYTSSYKWRRCSAWYTVVENSGAHYLQIMIVLLRNSTSWAIQFTCKGCMTQVSRKFHLVNSNECKIQIQFFTFYHLALTSTNQLVYVVFPTYHPFLLLCCSDLAIFFRSPKVYHQFETIPIKFN